MKRILSFILATAIILSLIPAAFAADTTLQNPSNVQIVYDACTFGGTTGTAVAFENITYETTQGFWKYHSAQTGSGSIKYGTLQPSKEACKWIAIAIYVPAAGDYTVNLTRTFYKASGCIGGMYILPGDTEDIAGEVEKDTGCITKEIKYNDPEYFSSGTSINATKAYDVGTHNFPAAGEYIVVYTQESIPDTGSGVMRPGTLMLTGGTGIALMGLREKEIEVAGTTSISTSKSTDKLRDAKTVSDVTYKSSNDSIAKVSADGIVTGVGNGSAVITVSGENYAIPLEVTIKVNDPKLPTIKYDISGIIKASASGASSSAFTETVTNGFFRYVSGQGTATKFGSVTNYIKLWKENSVVFEVYVPVAGTYIMNINYAMAKSLTGASVYVNEATAAAGHYDCYDANVANDYSVYADSQIEGITLNKGWNTIKFVADNVTGQGSTASIGTFTLSAGTGDALMPYLNGNSTLEIGETATLSGFLSSTATAVEDETYSVEGDAVTVGTDGTITAVAPGKATVTMTTSATATAGNTCTVDITVPDKAASDTVAYGTNINGTISVQGTGITRGTDVTVTAPEVSGKTFRHWVLGTEENGTVVWTEAEYTFPLMTNTYLTAVYTDAVETGTKIVEFFNWNGDYLSQSVLDESNSYTAPTPSLIGFSFNNKWLVDENKYLSDITEFGEVTRAVAEFTPVGSYTVDGTEYTYDADVTKTADQEMAWYRDDVLVGYGKEYTYNVWNTVGVITSKAFTEKAPVVVLDAHIKDGNACMIEYDNGGKTIKEVGILFGDSDATVDSADSKATSQWNEAHGQFTAKPRTAGNATHARGYIIYQDGTSYRVIYTDAIALTSAD